MKGFPTPYTSPIADCEAISYLVYAIIVQNANFSFVDSEALLQITMKLEFEGGSSMVAHKNES
jgi:hypothetical protein